MSADTIQVTIEHAGYWHVQNVLPDTAQKINEILNENHNARHCFYNELGEIFQHNHTVHHQLTLFACGATPELADQMHKHNQYYMQPIPPANKSVWRAYKDPRTFLLATGRQENYQNFLRFFEDAIRKQGLEQIVQEYVFGDSVVAHHVFSHLFHGVFHPIIHFGYGLEFQQPAIVAEGLAQALVHFDWYMSSALTEAEEISQINKPAKSLLELVNEASMDQTIIKSREYSTWDKVKDGVLVKGRRAAVDILSRYQVQPTEADVKYKAAELMNISVYMIAATQHPDKLHRVDFVLLHAPNSSVVICGAIKLPWLSWQAKARLLEGAARNMLIFFMAFASGRELSLDSFRDLLPLEGGWDAAISRGLRQRDDGHSIKLLRAMAYASEISKGYEEDPNFPVKQDDFLRIEKGIADSLNPAGGKAAADTGESWVRGVGFDAAWAWVPKKGESQAWRVNEKEGAATFPEWVRQGDWVKPVQCVVAP